MATASTVEILIKANDQASSALNSVKSSVSGLDNQIKQSVSSTNDLSRSLSDLAGRVAAIATVTAAIAGITTAIKAAIAATEQFNQTVISIASELTSQAAEGQGSFREMFERNTNYAKAFYEKLRQYDAERASSIEEMMTLYKSLITYGYQARLDEAKALSQITDLIKQKTAGQNFEVQVYQEIRGLLQGQVDQHSMLVRDIQQKLGPAWREILESHRKAGTLLQFIADLYPGLEASSEAMGKTLEAQTTTLKSQLAYIGREGLGGAYDDIVAILQRINNYLRDHADVIANDLLIAWQSIRGVILSIPGILETIGEWFHKFVQDVDKLKTDPLIHALLLAALGSRAGPYGALAGAAAGLGTSLYATAQRARERELGGIVEPVEPLPTAKQLEALGISATRQKVRDEVRDLVSMGTVEGLKKAAEQIAREQRIPPEYFLSLIQQESGWKQTAISPKGAIGLGQLMPETARQLGVDPRDALQNLRGSAQYLRQLLDQFNNDLATAIAAYNAGPGRVRAIVGPGGTLRAEHLWQLPEETRKFVLNVMGAGRGVQEREQAAKQAQSEAEKLQKFLDSQVVSLTEKTFNELIKQSQEILKEANKEYEEYLREKEKLDEQYLGSYKSVLEQILRSDELNVEDRKRLVQSYLDIVNQQTDEEINKLKEAYGERIPSEVLEKYRQAIIEHSRRAVEQAESAAQFWESAWKRAAENVQDVLANTIYSLVAQTKTAGDVLKNILSSILQIMSQMAAKAIMDIAKTAVEAAASTSTGKLIGGWISGAVGWLGGLFGAGAAAKFGTIPKVAGLNFTPSAMLPGYADGGISYTPTLAWVSEKGPEAHIPLQRGAVPVRLEGATKPGDIHIINVWDPQMVAQIAAQTLASESGRQIILNVVSSDLAERGVMHRTVRR